VRFKELGELGCFVGVSHAQPQQWKADELFNLTVADLTVRLIAAELVEIEYGACGRDENQGAGAVGVGAVGW
jgi:hypothetical protein